MTCAESHREKLLASFHSDRPHRNIAFQIHLVFSLSLPTTVDAGSHVSCFSVAIVVRTHLHSFYRGIEALK